MLTFGERRDVPAGILESNKRSTAGQGYGVVKCSLPAAGSHLVITLNVDLEVARQPRRGILHAHIAIRAGHPGATALAGVLAFPRPAEMILAYPAAIVAKRTRWHRSYTDFRLRLEVGSRNH